MISEIRGKNVPIKLWAPVHEVESAALDQLRNVSALPWVVHHVAAMADCHLGHGATVGSVIAMRGACSAAAVGVDIGCGMGAMRTSLTAEDLPESLKQLRAKIEERIPVGFNGYEHPVWKRTSFALRTAVSKLLDDVPNLDPRILSTRAAGRIETQMGTLGGGNHFIEVCLDTEGRVWLMLHSGSRNVGKELAELHIETAKELTHNQDLTDRSLAVFLAGTPEMVAYEHDLNFAQTYALCNRAIMLERLQDVMREEFEGVTFEPLIACHHNYLAREIHFGEELWITRKGAIRAGKGDLGIIPGSMGTRSYIVRGLGSPDSFESASHGAGRRMSRGAAKRHFTLDDLAEQTAGVECRKDAGVLDEIPGAYKSIDQVMANQADLVEVVAEVKAILCVKG